MTEKNFMTPEMENFIAPENGKIEDDEKNMEHESEEIQQHTAEDTVRKENIVLMSGTQVESSIRHLAGLVKEYGGDKFESYILNLGTKTGESPGEYSERLKKEIIDFLVAKEPKLIGVSIIDYEVERILDLVNFIHESEELSKIKPIIIAGGAQVIEFPERYIKETGIDAICYSRAWHFTDIIEAVTNGSDLKDIPGLLIKTEDGKILKTDAPDMRVTITGQPLPDESLANTFRIYEDHLVNVKDSGGAHPIDHHQYPHQHSAVLLVSEGCARGDCEFCSINQQHQQFKKMAGGLEHYRKSGYRTPENAIEVIKNFLENNPKTEYVVFNDNDLSMLEIGDAKKLMELYKEEIKLPFYCQCSPNTLTPEHIKSFIDGGLDMIEIGVQGSQKSNISSGYRRGTPDTKVFEFISGVAPYMEQRNAKGEVIKEGVKIGMDFINGNPQHSKEDLESTIELVRQITKLTESETENTGSWNLVMHNLTLDSERELAKKNLVAMGSEKESVGDIGKSDYHNVDLERFFNLKEYYLNIVLEWMNGVHNQATLGKLPRKLEDFFALFEEELAEENDFKKLCEDKLGEYRETLDFLTDPNVYDFLNTEKGKSIITFLNNSLPEKPNYSFHRKNRYDYDWSWADKQLKK